MKKYLFSFEFIYTALLLFIAIIICHVSWVKTHKPVIITSVSVSGHTALECIAFCNWRETEVLSVSNESCVCINGANRSIR